MQLPRRNQLEFVKDIFYYPFRAKIRIADIYHWKKDVAL
jgi:hypothetical protein